MRRNLLLLGGTGFVGHHMAKLAEPAYNVFAFGRDVDVRDVDALRRVVARSRPDRVVNLAGITTVRETFADPRSTYAIAFDGMLNILSVLKETGFAGRLLNVSSSEVYGHPTSEELPLSESSALQPMSPYAVAKVAAEFLCYQWSRCHEMAIVTARPFTHIGPGQSDRFAISSFAKQIAEIVVGRREPAIRVGNLDTTRDFTDVRDVVRSYQLLLEEGTPGATYNVCSGSETSLEDVLRRLIAAAKVPIKVETDSSMLRSAQQQRLRGSFHRLHAVTGWHPAITLDETLKDTLNEWIRVLEKT